MSSGSDVPDFSGWRVGELRRYLQERGVSTAGAVERSDLIALAEATAASGGAAAAPPAQAPPAPGGQQGASHPDQPAESFALNLLEALRRGQSAGHSNSRYMDEIERSLADPASRAALDAVAAHQFLGTPLPEGVAQLQLGPGILGFGADGKIATMFQGGGSGASASPAAVGSGGRSGAASEGPATAGGVGSSHGSGTNNGAGPSNDAGSSSSGAGAVSAAAAAPKRCAGCSKPAAPGQKLKRCGGCRSVHYCGTECQSRHWAGGHSEECRWLRQGTT